MRVKFRFRLIAFSVLLIAALIGVYILLQPKSTQAAWADDSYAYRLKISFTHNADIAAQRAVTYTLDTAELITAGLMQSDCDDIRFTDANGKVLLYDLTGTCNNASTTYEIIFSSIVNGSNLAYVYYGNSVAVNAEINSTGYTALTPSGGDPAAQTAPTANDEQGPGPIAYWRFDEGSGSSANDATGKSQTGTITAAAWKTEDLCVSGKCLSFDGSSTYVQVTGTNPLKPTTDLTVSAWVRTSTTDASGGEIISMGDNYGLRVNSSGTVSFFMRVSGFWDSLTTTITVTDSKWHHIMGVLDDVNNYMRVYIDGIQVAQATQTGSIVYDQGTNFFIGKHGNAGTVYDFNGFIDEVKVYNFAKSADQIKTEFASRGTAKGVGARIGDPDLGKTLSTGLVGYWKMDESSGNSSDSSGNALTLTNNGVTTFVSGKFANASNHNGTSQYFSTATTISGVQTVAFWVNPASTSDDYINLVASTAYINSSSGAVSATGFTSPSIFINGVLNGALTASVWNHVAVTTGTAISATAFETGRANGAYLNNTGKMDEVRVYNRALSPAEVASLYSFAPGPVGHWKADENTGTTASDSSGNGNTSSAFSGQTTWVAGKFGSALTFDGNDDVVRVVEGASVDLGNTTDSYTVSAWVKSTDSTGTLVGKDDGTGAYPFKLRLALGLPDFRIYDGTNNPTTTGTSAINNNLWHYLSGVRDVASDQLRIYVDGTLTNSSTDSTTATTANNDDVSFGNDGVSYVTSDLAGIVDDVRIYNYARTSKQIIEDMNAGHPAGGSPVGSQVVYWKFDEGQGTTANNSGIATSSNGTLTSIASPATSTSGWTFTGKVNKGIIFDGTDDNVVIATANDAAVDFATTEQFSGSAWVYVTTMPGSGNQDAIIAKWDETGNLAAYKLYVENDDADTTGNFEVQIYDESASQAITASQNIDQVAVNTWYHVAFTFNGGIAGAADDLKLYVNGRLVGSNAANASFLGLEDLASDFTVGDYDAGDAVANNTAFTGTIDEVKVYSGLLTQSEILVDMNAGSAIALGGVLGTQNSEGFSLPNPDAWWKLDDNTGQTAVDSSGNGFNGTLGTTSGTDSTDPSWSSGKLGSGLHFETSAGDGLSIADQALLDVGASDNMTIAAWVRRTGDASNSNPMYVVSKRNEGAGAAGYNFKLAAGVTTCNDSANGGHFVCFRMSDGTDTYTVVTTSTITADSQWHHVVMVWDNSSETNSTIYIDGAAQTVTRDGTFANIDAATNGVAVCIGHNVIASGTVCDNSGVLNTFNGQIDNVQVYKSTLTATQISYLYNRGAPQHWYKFDECQGGTAYNAATLGSGAAAGDNGTIRFGSTGNTSLGSCGSGTGTEMWNDGTTGKYNSALGFDGGDDYVDMGDISEYKSAAALSAEAWVTTNTLAGGEDNLRYVFGKEGETAATTEFMLRLDTSNDRFEFYVGGSGWVGATTGTKLTIATGTWYHLMGVYDGSNVNIYVNGVLYDAQAKTGTTGTTTQVLRVGNNDRDTVHNVRHWDGLIDNVRLYNYPLTAAQVKRAFNEGSAQRFGPASGNP